MARTAYLDDTFQEIREYAERRYKQDNNRKKFVFTDPSDPELLELVHEHEAPVRKEKAQRKADKSKEPLTARLVDI